MLTFIVHVEDSLCPSFYFPTDLFRCCFNLDIMVLTHDAISFIKRISYHLPPPYFTDGKVFASLLVTIFSSNYHTGHYGQTVLLSVSSHQRTYLQKLTSLSLCAFANCNLAVLCLFSSNGFLLAEWPFTPCL